jgi:hypothetical protein
MLDLDASFAMFVRGKLLNPHLQFAQIKNSRCKWPYSDRIRIQTQIIDNQNLITNRKVLDLGCHDGILSQAMSQIGARCVLATNVRSDMVSLVNQCLVEHSAQSTVRVIQHDLYDLHKLDELLEQSDTIHFTGTLMHLNHHYELFHHLCNSRPDHMILDSIYYDDTWYDERPMQTWRIEPSEEKLFGHDPRTQASGNKTFVGTPNLSWYRHALDMFGWDLYQHRYVAYVHFEEKLRERCVMLCKKRRIV